MLERVTNDPDSQAKDGGIHVYNRKARKLIDDITWAIYWHGAPQGNARMAYQRPIVAPDPSRYIITGDTHRSRQ